MLAIFINEIGSILKCSWKSITLVKEGEEVCPVLITNCLQYGFIDKFSYRSRGKYVGLLVKFENEIASNRNMLVILQIMNNKLSLLQTTFFEKEIVDIIFSSYNQILLIQAEQVVLFDFITKKQIRMIQLLQPYMRNTTFLGIVMNSSTQKNSQNCFINVLQLLNSTYFRIFHLYDSSKRCSDYSCELKFTPDQFIVLQPNYFVCTLILSKEIIFFTYIPQQRCLQAISKFSLLDVGLLSHLKIPKSASLEIIEKLSEGEHLFANYTQESQSVDFLKVSFANSQDEIKLDDDKSEKDERICRQPLRAKLSFLKVDQINCRSPSNNLIYTLRDGIQKYYLGSVSSQRQTTTEFQEVDTFI